MQRIDFGLEIKRLDDDGTFEGYASTFGERDQGGDIVAPGAFAKSIKSRGARGIKMLADHDTRMRVGVWESMEEDDRGLLVRGRLLTEKQIGKEAYIDLKSGAVDGLSIGGYTKQDAYDGRKRARVIKEFDLREISIVAFPMNESARIASVKSVRDFSIRELEESLERGTLPALSSREAKALLSGGFKALSAERDAGGDGGDDIAVLLRRNIDILKS